MCPVFGAPCSPRNRCRGRASTNVAPRARAVLDLGQRAAQTRPGARGEARGAPRRRCVADRASLLDPGGPAAVEHARLGAVVAKRPCHPGGEDPVVVVVGDDQILRRRCPARPLARRSCRRRRAAPAPGHPVDEVVLPVDEHRARERGRPRTRRAWRAAAPSSGGGRVRPAPAPADDRDEPAASRRATSGPSGQMSSAVWSHCALPFCAPPPHRRTTAMPLRPSRSGPAG